jgi:hypothetical protein
MLIRTPFPMRKATILSAVVLAVVFTMIAAAQTPCVNCLNLNLQTSYVSITANGNSNTGEAASSGDGYFQLPITGSTGASLPNGTYQGWCASSESDGVVAQPFSYTPASTYSSGVNTTKWNEVNWILNNKQFAGPATVDDVQHAIWIVINGSTPSPSPTAVTLAAAAQSPAGQSFVPAPGQVMGVLLTSSIAGLQNIVVQVQNPCSAIGDFVWNDTNGDGIQQAGEPGINGVTVKLEDSTGATVLATTTTGAAPAGNPNANGYYQFSGLCAATYRVAIDNTQAALSSLIPSPTLQGGNTALDSNPNPALVTLTAATPVDETIDFGYMASGSLIYISCEASSTAQVGVPYNSGLTISGGTGNDAFSITSGSLPPGLGLCSSSGDITGTPTAAGTFQFTAQVKDSSGTKTTNCGIVVDPPPASVAKGDTATIGFWHNKNGQALIDSLNGGPNSTSLANWLAINFPYLYGAHSSNNLTNKTNADVAALFLQFFGAGGQKTQAQILAGALASYATSSTLAGTTAKQYGFNSSTGGTGAKTYNVGSNGTAIGLVNNGSYTVLQLLLQANLTTFNGTFNANALNTIFDGINSTGDIS